MAFSLVTCSYCSKDFLKDNRHINENIKLGNKFYCSPKCQYTFKNKQKQLTCENKGCKKKFKRAPHSISLHNFCSHACAATFSNTLKWGPKKPKRLLTKEEKIKIWTEANRNHWKDYWLSHGEDYIISKIQDFVIKNGRIPVKREMGGIYKPARKYFGTWNNAIENAGFKPNPVMFADKCMANDGHICDSVAEKIIDDYLYGKGISHIRNFPYPEGNYIADFKVGNKLVEYFGLAGEHNKYDEIKKVKLDIARRSNFQLIEIYPQDLYPKESLNRVLRAKLNTYTYGVEARLSLLN